MSQFLGDSPWPERVGGRNAGPRMMMSIGVWRQVFGVNMALLGSGTSLFAPHLSSSVIFPVKSASLQDFYSALTSLGVRSSRRARESDSKKDDVARETYSSSSGNLSENCEARSAHKNVKLKVSAIVGTGDGTSQPRCACVRYVVS